MDGLLSFGRRNILEGNVFSSRKEEEDSSIISAQKKEEEEGYGEER